MTWAGPGWVEWIAAGGIVAGLAAATSLIVVRLGIGLGVLILARYLTGSWHAYFTEIARRELWVAFKVAAYPLVGNRVLEPGFDAPIVWLGVLVVIGFSMCMGVVFAVLAHGRSRTTVFALGIVFGAVGWIFDLALVNPSPGTAIEAIPSGLAMAFALQWYQRRFPRPSSG